MMGGQIEERRSVTEQTEPNFNVSMKSATIFANLLNEIDSTEIILIDKIEPIVVENDTALYIVNNKNNKGWYIFAGDKRAQNIIAYGKNGSFDLTTANKGVQVWLENMIQDIIYLKKKGKPETKSANYDIWTILENKYVPRDISNTIATKANIPNNDELENGYWEAYSINIEETNVAMVDHLMQTEWGQDIPWNQTDDILFKFSISCLPLPNRSNMGSSWKLLRL